MNENNYFNMDITTVLFLIFLVLKLTKLINWNWFFVILPLIINFVIAVVLAIITLHQDSKKNK